MNYLQSYKLFENIHDRWEQESIEREDIKEFAETLFVNLLDDEFTVDTDVIYSCLLYTSPSPRDRQKSRMPSSA